MITNPDYTTAAYYEQDPSGKYVASKDPYKAAGPVYSYTPAVEGTSAYWNEEDQDYIPGTEGTPESYNAVAKPAATWNQAKIIDPNSGYVSTTGGTPVATGDRQSNWKGSAPATPASVLVPTRQPGITPPAGVTPGTSSTPDPVPTSQPGINAPVVRENPYAMPATPPVNYSGEKPPATPSAPGIMDPILRAEGSPETGETGAAYGNPAMLAAGEKMRARKMLEQFDKKKEPVMRDPTEAEAYSGARGPRTLEEAAGLDPNVTDRTQIIPAWSKEKGWTNSQAGVDLAKLITASNPQNSHLMQPEDAMPSAMSIMGGGMGASSAAKVGGPGMTGMFIGPSSRMWRKKAIDTAEKMETEGRTPEEIWAATKSARAPWDNQWRQRISDVSMKMTGEKIPHENPLAVVGDRIVAPFVDSYRDVKNLIKTGSLDPWDANKSSFSSQRQEPRPVLGPKDVPLTQQVSWPRLQNAYPGLLESMVIHSDRSVPAQSGYHKTRNVATEVAPKDWKVSKQSVLGMGKNLYEPAGLFASRLKPGEGDWDAKSVIAHEGMHDIQDKEGFGSGANPDNVQHYFPNEYAATRHQYQLDAPAPSTLDKFLENRKTLKTMLPATKRENALRRAEKDAAYDTYQRVGGEAEARLVQAEKNMTQNELNKQYPYDPAYFKTQTGVDIDRVINHAPPSVQYLNRAAGSPPTGERSYEKTAREDYEQFRKNVMENPDSDIEFELRAAPRPSNALAEDMKGTNLQKVPPRTYFYNDADLNKKGWTATEGKNKGSIIVAAKESDDPKKIRSKVNTMGHELHHRRVGEVGEENMPLHPTWLSGGIPPEKQNSIYNPRWKLEEVMNAFVPARTPNAENHPTDISSMHWGRRPNRETQEQIANLAGYEAMQKTGTPISQTAVGKAMLEKDPALLDYFYSQTSAGRPGGGVWDMYSPEYKQAITPSMKEKAAEMFKKWLVSHGINTVNR
jgi:hypothetical protein